jgi:hypothetical protein
MIYVSVIDGDGKHIGDDLRYHAPHKKGGIVEMAGRTWRVTEIDREMVGLHGELAIVTVDRNIRGSAERTIGT